MGERERPDWARGLAAVGIALLFLGVLMGLWLPLMILGGLILLCVGVATAGMREPMGPLPKPRQDWEPGDRPWKRKRD